MATGEARRLQDRDPRPVAICGAAGRARWHPIFEGNPRLVRPGDPRLAEAGAVQWMNNRSGVRPYIVAVTRERFAWRGYHPAPGELYFSAAELQQGSRGAGRVIIEPTIKADVASPNKDWGFIRWQALVRLLPSIRWGQVGAPGARWLAGVERIETATFRDAAAVIASALLFTGAEGGLHHAAAAVGRAAVVIFGGYISPAQTGYDTHCNLFAGGTPCGNRLRCEHCRRALLAITPEMVAGKITGMLS